MAQASATRDYLHSLDQDGHKLPSGPVIISPDGLFPSLYRELVRARSSLEASAFVMEKLCPSLCRVELLNDNAHCQLVRSQAVVDRCLVLSHCTLREKGGDIPFKPAAGEVIVHRSSPRC